jgi:hypothetical protein
VRNKKRDTFWLGKQFHRLPNIGINVITDVGLDETSPYRANDAAPSSPLPSAKYH